MLTTEIEKRLTTIICWGAVITTLIVTDRVSIEPANLGKMLVLAVTAGASLSIIFFNRKSLFSESKGQIFSIVGFLLVAIISIMNSKTPWEKGFYGTFGRNTGFLTYLSLSILFLAVSQIKRNENYFRIMRVLLLAGSINIIYCLIASRGYDFFAWQNPYNKVLGTFGNPNFISSFMGIFVVALFSIALSPATFFIQRVLVIIISLFGIYIIKESGSQQGGILVVGGVVIVLFFFLRSKFANKYINMAFIFISTSGLVAAILGMLQVGPLTSVLYKESVSLRGEYWHAGINMGLSNPMFGVGLDSYGTFYRKYRDESAIIRPGLNTIADTAHNVFIDIFASTGLLGLMFFSSIIFITLFHAFKFIVLTKNYDPIFVFLFSTWVVYQTQAIISINQIGLAIWGWILGGLLYGYSRNSSSKTGIRESIEFNEFYRLKKIKNLKEIPAGLALSIFISSTTFFLIAVPIFYGDAKLRQALGNKSTEEVFRAVTLWPLDTQRIVYAASEISKGGINQQSVDLINIGLNKFPFDYGLLFSKFSLTASDSVERAELGKRLNEMDPLNPLYLEYK